ncbi:MAG: PQQ-binding-like beta-propeller repeat protein [Candidatus Bathyarchaeota archaeon]|nr:PQQ-binding-like beta-propeller repeat protein [Candidatus Bathyarchaeota archaeon]
MKTSKVISTAVVVILLLVMSDAAFFGGLEQGSLLTASAADVPEALSYSDLSNYEWPQFTGDAAFSHFSDGPAPEAPDILWKATINGIQPYISAFNNKVYVCTKTTVYALDESAGSVLWQTSLPESQEWPAVYKIDGHHMIIGRFCLDPDTGDILWTSQNFTAGPNPLFNYNVYSPEEKMFYILSNSHVQGWNFSDPENPPEMVWETYVSGSGMGGSGIQYGDGKVFPGSYQAHQMALDAKTGKVLWDTNTKAAMIFSGTYYAGKFFRGGAHDNTFYAFDAVTGDILWTYRADTEDGYFCTGGAAAYGMVYEPNMDGGIYAFDADTGAVVWKYSGPGPMMFPGNPTIADGKIYVTSGQLEAYGGINNTASEFVCLDAYTGHVIWKLPIEAFAPRESVAIAYGNLYMIPGNVTTAVDTISGAEYSTANEVWAFGTSDWPMFRHDAEHSAVGQSGPTSLSLRWNFYTDGAVISSPSIADGVVYFGSQDKNIYAVDARDGTFIWKFTTHQRVWSSPAVAGGRVFTGPDDGFVYCLNATDGSLIWSRFAGGDLTGNFNAAVQLRSSPTVAHGNVYVGALDNYTYCINAENGSIVWRYQTQGYITSSPAVAGGAVYVVSQEPEAGALYKLNALNGVVIWKHTIPYEPVFIGGTDMHASPVVGGGMVFVASDVSAYYAVDAATGKTVWSYKDPEAAEFILCSPIYLDGRLFIVDKFSIVCLNARNGDVIWTCFTGDELYVSPTYAGNKLYVVTDERNVWVLNATDGEKLGLFTMNSNSWSSASVYEGRVYVGSNDWNVYCLSEYSALTSSVTVVLDKNEVESDELVTGWGQLTPALSNATITVMLVKPDGSMTTLDASTTETGSFAFAFMPKAGGNWSVTAQWQSDKSFYKSATSKTAALFVDAPPLPSPSESPIDASPTPTHQPGQTPTPFDQLTFLGVPLLYVYFAVIGALIVVIVIAGYIYVKSSKK